MQTCWQIYKIDFAVAEQFSRLLNAKQIEQRRKNNSSWGTEMQILGPSM